MRTYDSDGLRYTGPIPLLVRQGDKINSETYPDYWESVQYFKTYVSKEEINEE